VKKRKGMFLNSERKWAGVSGGVDCNTQIHKDNSLVGKKPKDAGFTIIRAHARERVKSRPPLPRPPIHVKKSP
jgi:hypothetical protein